MMSRQLAQSRFLQRLAVQLSLEKHREIYTRSYGFVLVDAAPAAGGDFLVHDNMGRRFKVALTDVVVP